MYLLVKTLNLLTFTHAAKQNSPPGFYHYPPGKSNSVSEVVFSSLERGEKIMELKISPKLNLGEFWSQVLINSTIFATFKILVYVLLCHNVALNMLKCEGSLT